MSKTTWKKIALLAALLVVMTVVLTACIPGDGKYTDEQPAGFLSGIWHGWIAPVSLIIGIFDHHTRIYEPVNTGWTYDFGFYIAIISGFGGLSLTRRARRKEHHHHHYHNKDEE